MTLHTTNRMPPNLKAIFQRAVKVPDGRIQLVVPGIGKGVTRYLAGRQSPRGEIIAEVEDGQLVVYKSLDLLAWMTAHGYCVAST